MAAERDQWGQVEGEGIVDLDQTCDLDEWPDKDLIHAASEFVRAEYLTGDVVIHYLNDIFGPARWGYDMLEWPELVPLRSGQAGYFRCKVVLWVQFDSGKVQERKAPGLCAVRPGRGKSLEDLDFAQVRMGYEGSITEGIKAAAQTLGHRLGQGLNDPLLRRIMLGERVSPEGSRDVTQDMEDLGHDPEPEPGQEATPEGQWTSDRVALSRFWGWTLGKDEAKGQLGLGKEEVYEALSGRSGQITSLKQYEGSMEKAKSEIETFMSLKVQVQEALPF